MDVWALTMPSESLWDVDRHETCRYNATIQIDVAKNGLAGDAVCLGRAWPGLKTRHNPQAFPLVHSVVELSWRSETSFLGPCM